MVYPWSETKNYTNRSRELRERFNLVSRSMGFRYGFERRNHKVGYRLSPPVGDEFYRTAQTVVVDYARVSIASYSILSRKNIDTTICWLPGKILKNFDFRDPRRIFGPTSNQSHFSVWGWLASIRLYLPILNRTKYSANSTTLRRWTQNPISPT